MTIEPNFEKITDTDLIGLVAYCEKWTPKKVYDIAFAQVFPEKQLKDSKEDFVKWADKGDLKLPPIVREELIRAAKINFDSGNMSRLQYAWKGIQITRNFYFWIFILIIFWWWL